MSLHDRINTFRSSFQFRLFLLLTVLTAATTILFGSLYLITEIREIRRHATEMLQSVANGMADSVRLPLYAENIDSLLQSARETQKLPEIRGVEILAADGRVLVRIPTDFSGKTPGLISTQAEVRSRSFLFSLEPAELAEQSNMIGYVRLYRGTADLQRAVLQLVMTICIMGLSFWLLTSWLCYLLLQRVTRSFHHLMRGLEQLHSGDYSSPIVVETNDEPGRAALAVNGLAESLRQRAEETARYNAEHEQLQQQLIRNEKLEAVGILAGGIAHNFNNVLTGVLGYISFARKFLDESHRSYALLISAEKASNRAAGLANQLLTFAKGGAPTKKPASAAMLIDEAVSLATSGSKVQSRLELTAALHTIMVDEGQIVQAFSCICINAVQSMAEGGILTVRGRNVTTDSERLPVPADGSYVELSFEDQGCGIPQEDFDKIFTPYFTSKAIIGTGLGLATAHSIITRHGGAITFVSTRGAGTTFTLYLPAAAAPNVRQARSRTTDRTDLQAASGALLLVMDDEQVIRELAREVLEERGYRVILAVNGEEALRSYREARESGTPFMAAILDLTIPGGGMDGKETARQILAHDPTARLIVSSGYSNDAVMTDCRDYGFCAAVTKPYQAEELTRVLGQLRGSAG